MDSSKLKVALFAGKKLRLYRIRAESLHYCRKEISETHASIASHLKERKIACLYWKQVPVVRNLFGRLDFCYVLRFRPLRAFNDIKADSLALSEGLEAIALNGGIVDENISAVFLCQESETF